MPTYSYPVVQSGLANSFDTTGGQETPVVTGLATGGFAAAWRDTAGYGALEGGVFTASGVLTASTSSGYLDTSPANTDSSPDMAGLASGNIALVYQTTSGISFRILSPALGGVTSSASVISNYDASKTFSAPVVTRLNDDGFAVVMQYNYTATDHDIFTRIYNVDGSPRTNTFAIDASTNNDTHPTIASMSDGGYLVTWTRTTTNDTTLMGQRVSKNGSTVGGEFVIDSGVSEASVVGLDAGGFAVADVTGTGTSRALKIAIFDGGNVRTYASGYGSEGVDPAPSIARLSNNLPVVAYTSKGVATGTTAVNYVVVDPSQFGSNYSSLPDGTDQADVTALANGRFVVVARISTGSDVDIFEKVIDATRVSSGGSSADTFTGDNLNDVYSGNGGDDAIDGGGGVNTSVYSGASSSYLRVRNADGSLTIKDLRSGSPEGTDTLKNIQLLQFSDGVIATASATAVHDLGLDGRADLIWRNDDGRIRAWGMSGATQTSDVRVTEVPPNWRIVAEADVTGDGRPDLIWRNNDTGEVRSWTLNGVAVVADRQLETGVGTAWSVPGVGDFNADGRTDLVWRNGSTGDTRLWTMNAQGQVAADQAIANVPTNWRIAAVGDFDGDGRADIVWRSDAGSDRLWLMNGATKTADLGFSNGDAIPTNWRIEGAGDINGDGRADLVWHSADGQVRMWLMNGATVTADIGLETGVGSAWTLQDAADFNGDGRADLLWRNADTGEVRLWTMSAAGVAADQRVGVVGTDWHIVNTLGG